MMTLMPPPQYVHPPTVPVLEMRLDWKALHQLCGWRPFARVLACSFFGHREHIKENVCYVVLPKDPTLDIVKLRQHEIAHCNGWPANHPEGHWEDVSAAATPQAKKWWKWW